MNNKYDAILEEFYLYELHISEIYASFTYMFKADAEFWWKLSLEEKNHAALVASIRDIFLPAGKLPSMLEKIDVSEIAGENARLNLIIKELKEADITRNGAFSIALALENSAVEKHYQTFMVNEDDNKIDQVFRELNGYDKDHAARITQYVVENKI